MKAVSKFMNFYFESLKFLSSLHHQKEPSSKCFAWKRFLDSEVPFLQLKNLFKKNLKLLNILSAKMSRILIRTKYLKRYLKRSLRLLFSRTKILFQIRKMFQNSFWKKIQKREWMFVPEHTIL